MRNKTPYQKALGYAFKLNPVLYKDIVHDSYLVWYDKTKKDLFKEHERIVISVVKKVWWGKYIAKAQHVYKGEKKVREKVLFEEESGLCRNMVTPEDICIAKEFEEQLINTSSETLLEIYKLAVQGWNQLQIAIILGESPQFVNNYFKKMRFKYTLWN